MKSELELIVGKKTVTFIYDGRRFELRKSKGMNYLIELLSHAWRPIDAVTLSQLTDYDQHCGSTIRETNLQVAYESESGIPYCDPQTIHEVKRRLVELTEDYAEAEAWNDLARMDDLRGELDFLTQYLNEALLPCRRIRKLPSATLKAQTAVNKALVRAIAQISAAEPELGKQLRSSLHLWGNLVYIPDDLKVRIVYRD